MRKKAGRITVQMSSWWKHNLESKSRKDKFWHRTTSAITKPEETDWRFSDCNVEGADHNLLCGADSRDRLHCYRLLKRVILDMPFVPLYHITCVSFQRHSKNVHNGWRVHFCPTIIKMSHFTRPNHMLCVNRGILADRPFSSHDMMDISRPTNGCVCRGRSNEASPKFQPKR